MKKIFCLILLVFCALAAMRAQSTADSLTLTHAAWGWQDVGHAQVGAAQVYLFGAEQYISMVRYPARKFRTRIIHAPGMQAGNTSSLAQQHKAKIAVNASYFNMKNLTPATFLKSGGKTYGQAEQSELSRSNGLVMFKRHGRRIDIVSAVPADYARITKGWNEAIAAGPVLIEQGRNLTADRRSSFDTTRHPRTMIGYDADGWIYWVVVDGRAAGNAAGATIPEMAAIARYLGLVEALNLDGGGSSTLWSEATGVVNHPTDNHKFDHEGERAVPNIIIAK